jgi:hypothetical protein
MLNQMVQHSYLSTYGNRPGCRPREVVVLLRTQYWSKTGLLYSCMARLQGSNIALRLKGASPVYR